MYTCTCVYTVGAAEPVTADASVLFGSNRLTIEWSDVSRDFFYDINVSSDNIPACGRSQRLGAAQWEITDLQPSQGQMCNFSVETINACGCRSNPSSSVCVLFQGITIHVYVHILVLCSTWVHQRHYLVFIYHRDVV